MTAEELIQNIVQNDKFTPEQIILYINEIAVLTKCDPAKLEAFMPYLDKLIGNEMVARDLEIEAKWQDQNESK